MGDVLPDTVAPMGTDPKNYTEQIEENEARFALTPLYTYYHEMALTNEFMIDRFTGSGAMKLETGKAINISEVSRMIYHLSQVQTVIDYNLLPKMNVYSILPNFDCEVMIYDGVELLDDPITLYKPNITKGIFSIDVSILKGAEDCTMLQLDNVTPTAEITYRIDGTSDDMVITEKLSTLSYRVVDLNCQQLQLTSIKFPDFTPDDEHMFIVHSIIVAI